MKLILIALCLCLAQGYNGACKGQTGANKQIQATPAETRAVPEQKAVQAGNGSEQNKADTARWSDPVIVLQLLLFLAVVVQAGVYVWQAVLMRRTLRILKRQADALDEAGQTEQDQLTAMQDQIEVMKDSLKHSERALIAGETQAEAAKDSVRIAQETFYIGERPYFGITFFSLEISRLVTGNYAPRLMIHFQNGGKTPAWKFYAHVSLVFGDDPDSETRWSLNAVEPNYALRYFGTNQTQPFVFQRVDVALTDEQMRALNAETEQLFIVINAEYRDMRDDRLSQIFIGLWHPGTSNVSDWQA